MIDTIKAEFRIRGIHQKVAAGPEWVEALEHVADISFQHMSPKAREVSLLLFF